MVITKGGLEGVAVYALSRLLRDAIDRTGEAVLSVDLVPDMTVEELAKRLAYPRGKNSLANYLRKVLSLSPAAIGLAQEGTKGKLATLEADRLAETLKNVPVRLTATAPIARAISSAGGVPFSEIDGHYMLRKLPGVFVAGEMLDWEAPTGGYLLQASFATGYAAGEGAALYLSHEAPRIA